MEKYQVYLTIELTKKYYEKLQGQCDNGNLSLFSVDRPEVVSDIIQPVVQDRLRSLNPNIKVHCTGEQLVDVKKTEEKPMAESVKAVLRNIKND